MTQPPVHYPRREAQGYALCGYNFTLHPPDVPEHWITTDVPGVTCENCKVALLR